MRISKKVREEAALLCAISASNPDRYGPPHYSDVAKWLDIGVGDASLKLAYDAWDFVYEGVPSAWTPEVDAEAEALLRCGWSPE